MKKYMICLFLFIGVSAACLTVGYAARRQYGKQQSRAQTETEAVTAIETLKATEGQMVVNQKEIIHETVAEEFYLVAEDGFLLVFLKDKKTIYFYTHLPLMDFPTRERDKLREGIWFPSMDEVISYLESYTS